MLWAIIILSLFLIVGVFIVCGMSMANGSMKQQITELENQMDQISEINKVRNDIVDNIDNFSDDWE